MASTDALVVYHPQLVHDACVVCWQQRSRAESCEMSLDNPSVSERPQIGDKLTDVALKSSRRSVSSFGIVCSCGQHAVTGGFDAESADHADRGPVPPAVSSGTRRTRARGPASPIPPSASQRAASLRSHRIETVLAVFFGDLHVNRVATVATSELGPLVGPTTSYGGAMRRFRSWLGS